MRSREQSWDRKTKKGLVSGGTGGVPAWPEWGDAWGGVGCTSQRFLVCLAVSQSLSLLTCTDPVQVRRLRLYDTVEGLRTCQARRGHEKHLTLCQTAGHSLEKS